MFVHELKMIHSPYKVFVVYIVLVLSISGTGVYQISRRPLCLLLVIYIV